MSIEKQKSAKEQYEEESRHGPEYFLWKQKHPDPETRAPMNVECDKCGRRYCDHDAKY